jgi:hypothetical protein
MEPALGLDPRDSRCFLPIHIYEAGTGKPVAIFLRHVIGRIRTRWPRVEILVRGDSHGACPRAGLWPDPGGRIEAMTWCERNRVTYIFGLAGNKVLLRKAADLAEDVAVRRVEGCAEKARRHGEIDYAATS